MVVGSYHQETKYQEEVKKRLKSFSQSPFNINEAIKFAELGFILQDEKLVCPDCKLGLNLKEVKKNRLASTHAEERPDCLFLSLYVDHRAFVRELKYRSSRRKKHETISRLGSPRGWFSLENVSQKGPISREPVRLLSGHRSATSPPGSSLDGYSSNPSTSACASSASPNQKEKPSTSIWSRMTSFSAKHRNRRRQSKELARRLEEAENMELAGSASVRSFAPHTSPGTEAENVGSESEHKIPEVSSAPAESGFEVTATQLSSSPGTEAEIVGPESEPADEVPEASSAAAESGFEIAATHSSLATCCEAGSDDVDALVVEISSLRFQEISINPESDETRVASSENPMIREDARLESLGVATVAVVAAQTGFYRNPCDPNGVARCAFCNSTSEIHRSSIEDLLNRSSHSENCPLRENIPLAECRGPTPSPPISWFRSVSVPNVSFRNYSSARAQRRRLLQSDVGQSVREEEHVVPPFERNDSGVASSGIWQDPDGSIGFLHTEVRNLSSEFQSLRHDVEELKVLQRRNQEIQQETNRYLASIFVLLQSQAGNSSQA